MKVLKSIVLKTKDIKNIERSILDYYKESFFSQLEELLNIKLKIENVKRSSIETALASGTIVYRNGEFTGTFNATLSASLEALGAIWQRGRRRYVIDPVKLPLPLLNMIANIEGANKTKFAIIQQYLDQAQLNLEDQIQEPIVDDQLHTNVETLIDNFNDQFDATTSNTGIGITADLTPFTIEKLATDYVNNLSLPIKNWGTDSIVTLRKDIEELVLNEGYRAKSLETIIQNSFNVTQRKAKFLAWQESSLLIAKYRESRYKLAGITQYIWVTSFIRSRPDHVVLNGTIQSWDLPPIVNRSTGKRAHPGQDFNCHCIANPVIPS